MARSNTAVLYELGSRMRDSRKKKGRSLTDLSAAMGSDKSSLSRIENGLQTPGLEMVCRIADELDVPVAGWFVTGTGDFYDEVRKRASTLSPEQEAYLKALIGNALMMAGA